MKDRYGIDIVPGSVITYPNRQGSAMWMVTAIVTEIVREGLEVQSPREYMVFDNDLKGWYFKKSLKKGNISVVDRVTVLPHVSVASFKEDLDTYNRKQFETMQSRVNNKTKVA